MELQAEGVPGVEENIKCISRHRSGEPEAKEELTKKLRKCEI